MLPPQIFSIDALRYEENLGLRDVGLTERTNAEVRGAREWLASYCSDGRNGLLETKYWLG